jgi:hypothetical protein
VGEASAMNSGYDRDAVTENHGAAPNYNNHYSKGFVKHFSEDVYSSKVADAVKSYDQGSATGSATQYGSAATNSDRRHANRAANAYGASKAENHGANMY